MIKKMWKPLILGIILIASTQQSFGQIGQSRSDIIKEKGYDYKSGTTDHGTKYITYEEEFTTEQSGTFTQLKRFYFFESDDGTEYCFMWRIGEPSSETNGWVEQLNKDFVKMGYLEWKDYESNIYYELEVVDNTCILNASYDFKKK